MGGLKWKKKKRRHLVLDYSTNHLSLVSPLVDAPPNSCSLVVVFVLRLRAFEGAKFATILEQFD